MKALARPLRARILAILAERVASPKELAEELGERLTTVSYHTRVLVECGVIELDRKVQRRGAVEHFYGAIHNSLLPPNVWDRFTPAMRKGISAAIMKEFLDDASASMDAGVFDAPPGELSWTPLVLDEAGVEEMARLTQTFLESIFKAQSAASRRLAKAKGDNGRKEASATVFLASFLSARDPKDGRRASATKRR